MWNDIKLLNAIANALFGVCALLLVLAGLWMLMQHPMFTVNKIQVEAGLTQNRPGDVAPFCRTEVLSASSPLAGTVLGEPCNTQLTHVNAEIIRSTALPGLKGNFFTTNLDSVRHAFEMVPWVRKASVRREWPDKLIVTLEEHAPLGTWGENGELLSTKGEIFIANLAEAEEDTTLLAFNGPVGSEKEVLAHYLEFKDWFKKIGLEPEEVNYSQRYAWLIKLDNGLVVQLGREDRSAVLKERVERLLQIYPELASRLHGKIQSVDLRYPNGFALQRTENR